MKKLLIIIFFIINTAVTYSQEDILYYGMPYEDLIEILDVFVNESINSTEIENSEDADQYSEGLLYAAADISYDEYKFAENLNSLAYAILSLSLKEEYSLVNDLKYATNLEDIAIYLNLLGYYSEAIKYNLVAHEIISTHYNETEYYPDVLIRLATSNCKLGLYNEAFNYQQKAASIYKSMSGQEYEYGWALYNAGDLLYKSGDVKGSLEYFKQALEVINNTGGFRHLKDGDEFLSSTTLALIMQGNYEESLGYCQIRVALTQYLYGETSLEYSNALSNLGTCLSFLGQYDKASEHFENALAIIEDSPDCQYDYAITCDQYAKTLISSFKLDKAKKYLLLSKAIFESLNLKETYDYATLLQTIADYYDCLGIYDQSYIYEIQAHDIIVKQCHESSVEYITSFNRLATSEKNIGNFSVAWNIYDALLPIQLKVSGKESGYIKTLLSIADIYVEQSEYDKAYDTLDEAITLLSNISSAYELSCIYRQLGNLFRELKDYSSACLYYNKSLEILINDEVGSIYDTFYTKVGLSISLLFNQDIDKSLQVAHDINSIYDEVLANINSMNYAERYHFWKQVVAWSMDYFPYIVSHAPQKELVGELYNIQLKYKNYLLNKDIINRNGRLASFDKSEHDFKALFAGFDDFLNESRPILENASLTQNLNTPASTRPIINIDTLRCFLAPKDIAIEFIEVPEVNKSRVIYALLLKKSYDSPKLLKLCYVEELPKLPKLSKYPTKKQLVEYEEYYQKLYEKIWYPLEKELANIKQIYFSPSLNMQQVGVEYAVNDKESINEKYNIIRLSTTGMIQDYVPEINYTNSLLLGGLDMGYSSIRRDYFSDISNSTYDEVVSISDILKTRNNKKAEIISGDEGDESTIKEYFISSISIDLVHIATHGFWWSKSDVAKQFKFDTKDETSSFVSDDPNHALCRSGIALSNANLAIDALLNYDDSIDGILTAIEAKDLDLNNVELLTLSACQTGLGDLTPAGTYGLQRGFKIAGVNKIMMSLWEVETNATKILMTEFYKNLVKGRSSYEALRIAQRKLKKTNEYNNPYFWASFVILD